MKDETIDWKDFAVDIVIAIGEGIGKAHEELRSKHPDAPESEIDKYTVKALTTMLSAWVHGDKEQIA